MYLSKLFEMWLDLLPYPSPIYKFSLLFIGNFSSFRRFNYFFFTRRYLGPIKSYRDDRPIIRFVSTSPTTLIIGPIAIRRTVYEIIAKGSGDIGLSHIFGPGRR
jgi:hypothetical protein